MSRLDKLKDQHPELNVSLIDIIASVEPSETYKYMGFLIKILKNEYYKKGDVIGMHRSLAIKLFDYTNLSLLIDFENHSRANRLSNPDIGQYHNFNEIGKEVKRADEVVKLKELEKQVIKLYETDFWLVVIPLSFEASKVYGANTKWCTVQEKHWNDYKTKYKLIYIINKKSNVKYAVSSSVTEDKVQGWLANDKESNPMLWSIPNDVMNVLVTEVRKRESVNELSINVGITSAIKESKKSQSLSESHIFYENIITDDDFRQHMDILHNEEYVATRRVTSHSMVNNETPINRTLVNELLNKLRDHDPLNNLPF